MTHQPTDSRTNASWLSLVAEQDVVPPDLVTLDEVTAFRSDPTRDLSKHNVDLPKSVEVRHETLGEVDGLVTQAEIYIPRGAGPYPMMLYLHGGGWCLGKAEYVRKLGMSMAEGGLVVVNLDYALAPEHPFPSALRQAVFATRWMTQNASDVKGDGGPVAVGGASAGANLAAASIVAITSDQSGDLNGDPSDVEVTYFAAVFLYGVFNFPLLMQKPGTHAGGFAETMFNLAYLGPHWLSKHWDPLVSPALAPNIERFPPSYLLIGDQDSLVPQTLDMAQRLVDGGVPTTVSVAAGLDHSFAYIPHRLPKAAEEIDRLFEWLQARMRNEVEVIE